MELFQSLWIPMVLPGQNTIIDASKTVKFTKGRGNGGGRRQIWSKYAAIKKTFTNVIVGCASASSDELTRCESAHFHYVVSEPSRKRDPSNAAMGAIKFVEDALQVAGVIPNDGWKNVLSISISFVHAPSYPGVLVIMSSDRITDMDAMREYELKKTSTRVNVPSPEIEVDQFRKHRRRRRHV